MARPIDRAVLKARELLERVGTKAYPVDLEAVAERAGIARINEVEIPGDAAAGFLVRHEAAMIVLNASIREPGRKRFTIGHELGHYVFGHRGMGCGSKELMDWSDQREEMEANRFAVEILLPEALVKPTVTGKDFSYEAVESLATSFKSSLTAAAIRFIEVATGIAPMSPDCPYIAKMRRHRKGMTCG